MLETAEDVLAEESAGEHLTTVFSTASGRSPFVLDQGARRRTVLQAAAISGALVGQHLKPVVKVLELGVYGPHRAYFPTEAASDAIVLPDEYLHKYTCAL
jgi:hypothetical protein